MLSMKKARKAKYVPHALHVKTGDTVMVISGKDKGKTGIIKRVFMDRGKILVEGVNIIKKATRPNQANLQGGIIEMEAPLQVSKVMLFDHATNKPVRIRHQVVDGKKVRVAAAPSATQFD
jgi:large subunit ribosomal protein L24